MPKTQPVTKKFLIKQGFRITEKMVDDYERLAAKKRAMTPVGEIKPSSLVTWLTVGAVYIKGDVIEVDPVEAVELSVVAPEGALEEISHV